jgi:hypothetical protein
MMQEIKESSFLSDKQSSIIFKRDNGLEVELVASYFPNPFNSGSLGSNFDYYALVREEGKETRCIQPKSGSKSLNGMSVKEYIEKGRVGLMAFVRPNELFKVALKLEEKLCH